jgi:hypothetical protein
MNEKTFQTRSAAPTPHTYQICMVTHTSHTKSRNRESIFKYLREDTKCDIHELWGLDAIQLPPCKSVFVKNVSGLLQSITCLARVDCTSSSMSASCVDCACSSDCALSSCVAPHQPAHTTKQCQAHCTRSHSYIHARSTHVSIVSRDECHEAWRSGMRSRSVSNAVRLSNLAQRRLFAVSCYRRCT